MSSWSETTSGEGLYDFLRGRVAMRRGSPGGASIADQVRRDLRDLKPRDMIDVQSFPWIQGSEEYEE